MITARDMKKIKEFSLHLDWDVAFSGRSKGNRHLFRVRDIALMLSRKEGGRKDVIEAASWLHNVGLIYGDKGHDVRGRRVAQKFLSKLKLQHDEINQILHCIEAHEGNVKAASKEAMVVHDADVLDKMGPLGIIRQTWKLANSGFPTERICKMLRPYLLRRKGNLYTETAKTIAAKLDADIKPFFKTLGEQVQLKFNAP